MAHGRIRFKRKSLWYLALAALSIPIIGFRFGDTDPWWWNTLSNLSGIGLFFLAIYQLIKGLDVEINGSNGEPAEPETNESE